VNKKQSIAIAMAAFSLSSISCGKASPSSKAEMAPVVAEQEMAQERNMAGPGAMGGLPTSRAPAASAMRAVKEMKKNKSADREDARGGGSANKLDAFATAMEAPAEADAEGGEAAPAATRSWFPESFLFEPRVVTDETGRGSFDVKVPDRLTTWRVLALAHTRSGEQAGAVTSFLGTLPVYVEPVVPRQLIAGDVVRIPIQLVNTTEATVSKKLTLSIEGGTFDGPSTRTVNVPGGGSAVELVTVHAPKAGQIALEAELAGVDAILRTITVLPKGKRVVVERSGTLASPRSLSIEAPAGESSEASLTVFPGALAIVRTELATAGGRGGVADDAYALLLAGEAPALLAKLGGDVDQEALRTLRIIATQRALRHARVATLEVATMLAEAALANPESPVLERLGERLMAQLAQFQRPDGTYGGQNGWTLQRLLASTAESVHAVSAAASKSVRDKSRAEASRIRASAAVERNLGRIEDPYTAALLIASGAASGSVADQLRKKIREGVVVSDIDGSRSLTIPAGVTRADGLIPSAAEAAAVAVLALQGDDESKAWVADLSSTVLAGYNPGYGFGDGRASLWCLRAVLATFSDPLPTSVKIALDVDGAPIASGTFDAKQLRDVLSLSGPVPRAAGVHKWGVQADPAVAGLGYRLSLTTWVPWTPEPEAGLTLEVRSPNEPRVGRASDVTLVAIAPAGYAGKVIHRLPAGVVPDVPSLDALVSAGLVSSYDTEDGAVRFSLPPLAVSTPWQATYRVVPTLGGTLSTGASMIEFAGETRTIPPEAWSIKP